MSIGSRIAIGAIVGILLALGLHPVTRPYYNPISNLRESQVLAGSPLLPGHVDVAPPPDSESSAGYWMVLGAERIVARKPLTEKELAGFVEVSTTYQQREPSNAYWGQMAAIFLAKSGREADSIEAWKWASRRDTWDDHQNARLRELRSALSMETGGPQSWHWIEAYGWRSTAPAALIRNFGLAEWRASDPLSKDGLMRRYRILVNARRLRDGSRQVGIFSTGMQMLDFAPRVTSDTGNFSPRQLLLTRLDFANRLEAAGLRSEADNAREVFRQYGSWNALVNPVDAGDNLDRLMWESLIVGSTPSAGVSLTLVGLALAVLGGLFVSNPQAQRAIQPHVAPWVGVGFGIVIWVWTRQVLAALVVASVFAYFSFIPSATRAKPPTDMGPFFRFVTFSLSLVIASAWCVLWASSTATGQCILPKLKIIPEFNIGSSAVIGILSIMFALVLLFGPIFSLVERYPATKILAIMLRQIGLTLITIGLVGAIGLGPIGVIYDREIQDSMARILDNEPSYFYNRSVGPGS